ncbi:MAG TPA: hypothetical protein VMS56_09400 [Thermoanaerobaculia bacterium]|nr:hypothetical protein [Thermoanaerobaculia bacterium]
MKRTAIAFASVLALACGSGVLPDLGSLEDIFGSSSPDQTSDVRGTVLRVDTSDRRIDLDVSYVNNLRDDQTGSIYYDDQTVVEYQNRTYSPVDLERGDEIGVVGRNSGGRYIADRITVLRNVRGGP